MKALIVIALVATVLTPVASFISPWAISIMMGIAMFSAIIAMVIDGTLKDTRYFKIILIAAALSLIGALMRVLHLPYADYIVLFGESLMVISYAIHFYYKPVRKTLDILKLIMVVLLYSPTVLPHHEYGVGLIALAITFAYFMKVKYWRNVQVR